MSTVACTNMCAVTLQSDPPSNCSTVCGACPPFLTLGTAPWPLAAACAPAAYASSPADGSGPSRSASAGGWYAAEDEAPPLPAWLPGSQYVLSSV